MEIILDKGGLLIVTIWTILAHVTLFTTSVANMAFVLSRLGIFLLFLSLLACGLRAWRGSFLHLAAMRMAYLGHTQSNRHRWLVRPPMVST